MDCAGTYFEYAVRMRSRLAAAGLVLVFCMLPGPGLACLALPATTSINTVDVERPVDALDRSADSTGNCLGGAPATTAPRGHNPLLFVSREGYSLGYSGFMRSALWVCEIIEANELTGDAKRKNRFKADPLIPGQWQSQLSDYKYSGFDRGHLAAAGNYKHDQELNNESFYLSNMAPQVPGFNQQIWRELEELSREYVDEFDTGIYVITGGFLEDHRELRSIGANKVVVPSHFYKILVRESYGEHTSLAFVLENRKHRRPFHFAAFLVSIDSIEARTGQDFFPRMPATEQRQLEGAAAAGLW